MTFLHPWWLVIALLCVAGYFLHTRTTAGDWRRVIHSNVLDYLTRGRFQPGKRYLAYLVACLGAIALSSPSVPSTDEQTYQHAQGWIVLADVSRSMTLGDIAPSRLSAMRDAANQLARRSNASSITLIIYSGDAFIVAPPSYDTANFIENTSLLEYGTVPLDGSNVTRALSLAYSVIEGSQLINARLFILSDTGGFNTRSDAAVARLASLGHRTDLILFGSDASTSAAPFDLTAAQTMAKSSGGTVLLADGLGRVQYGPLSLDKLDFDNQLLTQSGITTLRWSNQSHWVLLLTVPLMLVLFLREFK